MNLLQVLTHETVYLFCSELCELGIKGYSCSKENHHSTHNEQNFASLLRIRQTSINSFPKKEKLIFSCKNRRCKGTPKPIERRSANLSFSFTGRCHTNLSMTALLSQPTSHSHAPTPDAIPVIELKNEIKTRAATTDGQSSAILQSALRSFPLSAAGQLPRTEILMNTIRRQ